MGEISRAICAHKRGSGLPASGCLRIVMLQPRHTTPAAKISQPQRLTASSQRHKPTTATAGSNSIFIHCLEKKTCSAESAFAFFHHGQLSTLGSSPSSTGPTQYLVFGLMDGWMMEMTMTMMAMMLLMMMSSRLVGHVGKHSARCFPKARVPRGALAYIIACLYHHVIVICTGM